MRRAIPFLLGSGAGCGVHDAEPYMGRNGPADMCIASAHWLRLRSESRLRGLTAQRFAKMTFRVGAGTRRNSASRRMLPCTAASGRLPYAIALAERSSYFIEFTLPRLI